MIDYELIDQDARVSASNDHEISPVGQAFGDIEHKNTVGVESICEVGVYSRLSCAVMFVWCQ